MLQNSLRRLLPSAASFAPLQQASSTGAGAIYSTDVHSSSSSGAQSAHFHIPSLLTSFGVKSEREQDKQTAVPQGTGMLSANQRFRGIGGNSLMPFASRHFHALSSSRSGLAAVQGLGLSPRRKAVEASSSPIQVRSYSEGELIGAAYLMTTDIMFWSGLIGAVVFRRNLIVMLLCTEIVMLACNMNFLFASAYLNDMTGVIMSITITTIAACETAIGLALCVTYFHIRSATDVEALNLLK